jgi:predicted transcriptional regulator of viral defense system
MSGGLLQTLRTHFAPKALSLQATAGMPEKAATALQHTHVSFSSAVIDFYRCSVTPCSAWKLPQARLSPAAHRAFSGEAWTAGVETHVVDGVPVRITGVAKTVADCFKYRDKIGLDVAPEALREVWRNKCMSSDELWRYAKVCRVANVMRPYLDSLA